MPTFCLFCVQVSKNSSKKNVGTGLGLCITKALLERMNGILTVTSEEGECNAAGLMATLGVATQACSRRGTQCRPRTCSGHPHPSPLFAPFPSRAAGKGTTFTFDVPFPVDEVEERDEEVESSSSSEPGSFWIPTAAPPEAAAAAAAEEKRSAPDPDTEEESSAPLPALRVALCLHSAALRAAIDRVLSADDGFTVVQVAPEPILAFEPAGGAQAAAGGSGAAEEEAQPAAADYACGRRRKGRRNSLYQSGPIPLSPSLQALHALAHLSSATDSEEGEASSAPSDPPLAPPESPSAPPVAPAPAPTDQASAFVAAIDAACPGSDTCVIVVDCTVLIALLRQARAASRNPPAPAGPPPPFPRGHAPITNTHLTSPRPFVSLSAEPGSPAPLRGGPRRVSQGPRGPARRGLRRGASARGAGREAGGRGRRRPLLIQAHSLRETGLS